VQYVFAMRMLERMSRELIAPWGRDFDVLLTPTMAIPPPRAGAVMEGTHAKPDELDPAVLGMVTFTAFVNATGLPAISLPVHWNEDGLPIGAQLIAGPWQEDVLVRLAAALEEALPWAEREPQLARA
jgi:amidase